MGRSSARPDQTTPGKGHQIGETDLLDSALIAIGRPAPAHIPLLDPAHNHQQSLAQH